MAKAREMVGLRFGELTVLERANDRVRPCGEKVIYWKCKCSCGNIKEVDGSELRRGNVTSCGCQWHKTGKDGVRYKHGETGGRLYKIWSLMKSRCYKPSNASYDCYGGRGITVCDEWKNDYLTFKKWAIENGYDFNAPFGECTIDRIDTNGNYTPDNCRWATMKEQNNNRRTNVHIKYNGDVKNLTQWAEYLNTSASCLWAHLKRGQDMEHIVNHFLDNQS